MHRFRKILCHNHMHDYSLQNSPFSREIIFHKHEYNIKKNHHSWFFILYIHQLQFNYKSLITKSIQRSISLTRRGFRNKFQGIKKKLKDEKRSKGFIEGLSRCWDENHATVRSVGARSEFRTRRNYDTGGFYRGGSDACGIHVAETRSGSVDVFARK